MKLELLEVFPVRVAMKDQLASGTFSYPDYQATFVRVVVDGEVGWGEAMSRFSPAATALLVRWMGRQVGDADFQRPEQVWEMIWRHLRARGHTRGLAVEALSGLEIALWDAFGKLQKSTVGDLLSRRRNADVPAFAGSVFRSRGQVGAQVERAKELGLVGCKLKVGFGLEDDLASVRQVRKLWDEAFLVVDANGAYDVQTAKRLMKALMQYKPEWLEEPLPSDDFGGYRQLGPKREVPVGAGETWFPGDLPLVLAQRSIDVLETSVSRCGGIRLQFDTAQDASMQGISFSPMLGVNSAVSLAASLQVAAGVETLGVEYDSFDNPLIEDVTPGFPFLRNGEIRIPKGKGLGIEVDERFLRSHLSSD